MEATPPLIDEPRPINRRRWWIHLILIAAYLLVVAAVGMGRNKLKHPALSHTAGGLLLVCAVELLTFGMVFGLAWLASRASADDLLLRWRGRSLPVWLGVGYSIGLRVSLGLVFFLVEAALLVTRVATPEALQDLATKNRPGVENVVDMEAMRHNPAYYWLTLTVVSFVVAGMREELWRSSFLAGLKTLWPRQFGSTMGQVGAVCIAAVLFGVGHLSMGGLAAAMAGVLGLGLGLIMVYHRSIWPAVIAHGFFDATSLALMPWAMETLQHLPKH